jgi:endonuclease YncB( thermonuclease family)
MANMKIRIAISVLLASVLLFASNVITAKVIGVSDGDTIKILHNNREVKVRLYGIDSPEKKMPYGTKAKQFASAFCFNQIVEVHVKEVDHYGRTVAEVFVNGESLNQAMVKNGYAWWYRKYAPNDTLLQSLEDQARIAKRGLWKDPKPRPPWEWRKEKREKAAIKKAQQKQKKNR